MVHLSSVRCYSKRTFGLKMKKYYNHRVPIQYKKFAKSLDPEAIVEHYSRDDLESFNPREGERTYKDAQETVSRKGLILPNLSDADMKANDLFQKEMQRQRAIIARINKIRVVIDSVPGKDTELIMNKEISTPYDCTRHIHDLLSTRSVVAEVRPLSDSESVLSNDAGVGVEKQPAQTDQLEESNSLAIEQTVKPKYWDMHRPLEDDCRIRFKHFTDKDLSEVNKIYWRSCNFVLGMAIRLAFKDDVKVLLHSWPKPNIKSGSFVYDVALNLNDKWKPDEQELRAFTKVMWNIKKAAFPFERLQVEGNVARELFASNPFKMSQINSIVDQDSSQGKVTVYRCGGLLDISVGPMISNTNQIGRISLASVHPFESESEKFKGVFYRFQGVSLPQQLPVSSYLYQNVLINNAKKLNRVAL